LEQLRSNIASSDLKLSAGVLEGIQVIHEAHPNPSP
jgi:aryl-alcohol dehydrogenase-like predicted oxidoreductase